MRTEDISFYSDGHVLRGTWHLPDDLDESRRHPVVIPCSGFTGLKDIHPARFARYLTAHGYVCFAFDYRGFGDSEGTRGRVVLDEQVRDIIHGTAFVESDPRVDRDRLVLLGWGMGGGLVLDAARELMGVVGLVVVNGFYRGKRVQIAHRTPEGYLAFRDQVRQEYVRRATTGRSDQGDPFSFYPLDSDSELYVDNVLRLHDNYDTECYSADLADSLLRFDPEAYAPHMRTPLLIAHGTRNALHLYTEAEALYEAYGGEKEIHWIYGAGHTEFMHDDDPRFQQLGGVIVDWLGRLLKGRTPPGPAR